jgi:hypothetical protein
MCIKKIKLSYKILGVAVCISISTIPVSRAAETSTAITETSKQECYLFPSNLARNVMPKIVEIIKLRADFKVSNTEFKSSEKIIKRISELGQFDCERITESFWQSIKPERNKEIDKALANFDAMYTRYMQMKGITITCYKSGVTKNISGKNPVCPKGFKKVN